jgi:membrane-associated PAP2 superfamily phosphatase
MHLDYVMEKPLISRWLIDNAIWLLPSLGLMWIVIFGIAPLDFAIENYFYTVDDGFYAKHNWFLETVLHDYAKQAMMVVAVLLIVCLVASFFVERFYPWKKQLIYLVSAILLSTIVVTPLKRLTNIHCPWDLQKYGGDFQHVNLLDSRLPQVKAGQCWPGGHAASGFCWFAFFFAFRDSRPLLARRLLIAAVFFGGVFSLGRMMQGAHFLSHNIATACIDWLICFWLYHFMLRTSK